MNWRFRHFLTPVLYALNRLHLQILHAGASFAAADVTSSQQQRQQQPPFSPIGGRKQCKQNKSFLPNDGGRPAQQTPSQRQPRAASAGSSAGARAPSPAQQEHLNMLQRLKELQLQGHQLLLK